VETQAGTIRARSPFRTFEMMADGKGYGNPEIKRLVPPAEISHEGEWNLWYFELECVAYDS
jgi:hypothetical protein